MRSIRRLDELRDTLIYDPITTQMMEMAAELWATSCRIGKPTSDPHALDGDVILAAHAMLLVGSGDTAVVATTNVGHLGRFMDVVDWANLN